MSSTFTFTPSSITVKGKTFPAGYSVSPSGAVFVFVQQDDKPEKTRVRFNPDHPDYAAALAAARNEQPAAPADERPEIISEAPAADPAPAADLSPIAQVDDPAQADDPAPVVTVEAPAPSTIDSGKAARGPIPEKTFIGKTINGNGWKILFDGETSRTRIIFDAKPTDAARDILSKAGFFFSAAMNSWNKKLTFKAYRAAQAVSSELSAIYA